MKTSVGSLIERFGKVFLLYFFVLLALSSSGCSLVGHTVALDKRVLLQETGNSTDTFKSGGLTVEYSYDLSGDTMNLEGQVWLRHAADTLDVSILFLDSEGRVLKQTIVYSSGYRYTSWWGRARTFKEKLTVPPGTAALSFYYTDTTYTGHR